jgi:hypothetical protein
LKLLSLILLFLTIQSFGIKGPPQILRACINSKDSIVTISWRPPSDACASFTHYTLFASYNGGGFVNIASFPNLFISEYPHKINNSSTKWQYFLRIYSLCDGSDSSQSETLSIDIERPKEIELDSLSYDITTQNIIAGWSKNPSADTKLYKIYNFSSGNGDSIGVTQSTLYTVSYQPAIPFPVVIATLDSCNLSSVLSSPHKPTELTGSIDTCKRQVSLNWTPYQGWNTIDSQTLFVSINNSTFIRSSTMSGSTTNLTYNDIALGDRLSFIIRSYTKSGIISSSSNLLTFVTRRPIAPLNLYLSNITVNDEKLEVYFKVTEINDTWQLRILKGTNRTNLTDMFTINKEDIIVDNLYIDENVNVAETRYYYQIESLDKCNTLLSVSNISSNIVLQIGDNLEHNEYDGWINGVKEYELLQSLDNGSTWNTVRVSEELLSSNLIPTAAGCFIVQASETPNNTFKTTSISRSNTVCIVEEMTSFIVTAVNPTSANNRFTITGSGINHSTSFYQIYNRWGELLVQNPTNESWDLVYNQQLIPLGRYIYIVHLYGTLGEKKIVKGTLNVIR